ncbi:MAG: hypothetical protein WA099_06305 [Sulfuricurvum sp.]
MSFNWSKSLKFKISFIFAILMAIAFSLNWMVALQTMRSEKISDIQKVLKHLLNESNDEYITQPLTPDSSLTFLYSIPHNQMILDDSEVSALRFLASKHPYIPYDNEIVASVQQPNSIYLNAISNSRKIDTALDKYAQKLLTRYLFSLLAILLISIFLLNYYMKSLAALAKKTHDWQIGDPFDFSLDNAGSEIKEVSIAFESLIRKIEGFRRKEGELFKEAAHELKTPLALMRSRLDVYEYTQGYDKNKFIVDLGHDIERLTTELKNVLFLESSDYEDPITLDITTALRNIVQKVDILAKRKQLLLQLPSKSFIVSAPERLLKKVLLALIENAMTYAPENSQIHIEIDPIIRTITITNDAGHEKYLFSSKIGHKMLQRLSEELNYTYQITQYDSQYAITLKFS